MEKHITVGVAGHVDRRTPEGESTLFPMDWAEIIGIMNLNNWMRAFT
jgi:hypothetical protein